MKRGRAEIAAVICGGHESHFRKVAERGGRAPLQCRETSTTARGRSRRANKDRSMPARASYYVGRLTSRTRSVGDSMPIVSIKRIAAVSVFIGLSRSAPAQRVEWPAFAGDLAATKFSPLADVNRDNVARLTKAWEWATGETPNPATHARPGNFQATPLMIGDTLFLSTSYNRVIALDASTGRELWAFDPKTSLTGQPPNGTGFVHRGVATWTDGQHRRVFINSRWNLIAIDASTGRPIHDFGDTGYVDLTRELTRNGKPVNKYHYTETSPPVVWQDLVIVGNGVADRLVYPNDPPGDVQAFDVRTGRRVWNFSPVPRTAQDVGAATWKNESWKTTGHTNVWVRSASTTRVGWSTCR